MRKKWLTIYLAFTCFAAGIAQTGYFVEPGFAGEPAESMERFQLSLQARANTNIMSGPEDPIEMLTLPYAIGLALKHNPELAVFSDEISVQEARVLQSRILPNPELEFEMEEFGGTGDYGGTGDAEISLQLSQFIELGGKRAKRTSMAGLEQRLAEWDLGLKQLDVFSEVTKTFVDVLAAQKRILVSQVLVQVSKETLEIISERVNAGKVSPVEEISAKIEYSTALMNGDRLQNELETARLNLAATWGATVPRFRSVTGDFEKVKPLPDLGAINQLREENPALVKHFVRIALQEQSLAFEHSKRIPDIEISGGITHFNGTDDLAFHLGVSIPIPLFDRNQGGLLEAHSRINQAQNEKIELEKNLEVNTLRTMQSLSLAYRECTALSETIVPGSKHAFEAMTEGYRQGKFDYLHVLDAQRTLNEVQEQYIDSLVAYHHAVSDLERLVGMRLSYSGLNDQPVKDKEGDSND